MYACLAVTCHLHFWQNDRDFLRATVVTRGWNGYRNKSQRRKSTLEKKILSPFQQGFEPATFQSRVRRSNHWAVPAPLNCRCCTATFYSKAVKTAWVACRDFVVWSRILVSGRCRVQDYPTNFRCIFSWFLWLSLPPLYICFTHFFYCCWISPISRELLKFVFCCFFLFVACWLNFCLFNVEYYLFKSDHYDLCH